MPLIEGRQVMVRDGQWADSQAWVRQGRLRAVIWAVICVLAATVWEGVAAAQPLETEYAMGLFEVYARNKDEGVPNYMTEDVLLLSYGMIRTEVGKALERERDIQAVRQLIEGLSAQVAAVSKADDVNQANRDYLAILTALINGRDKVAGAGVPKRAQAELDQILAAQALAPSPLWGQTIDYTQFKPRGHYSGDDQLKPYFRAVRYGGTVLFAIQASKATGVSEAMARRMTQQALRLARLIEQDDALGKVYHTLLDQLTWRFGPPEDVPNAVLLAVDAEPAETFRQRLLDQARAQGLQPRIMGGVVDTNQLEDGLTAADVMTGWRLLPQRYTPESAAFRPVQVSQLL